MAYPNGIAAKALKARCLIYAASELNNLHGQSDWQDAADACAEAIRLAQQYGYDLVPFTEWNSNFYGTKYTNEHIWAWNYGSSKINTTTWSAHFGYPASNYTNASGDCPTQNFVDRFETLDGDPLLTEADRAAAAAAGHYNEQDPYTNRDPRLDKTILHDGSVVAGCPAGINIHYDPATGTYPTSSLNNNARTFGIAWGSNDSKGYSNTGYYVNKLWNGALGTAAAHQHTDPLIRMAELYLNYAEAYVEYHGTLAGQALQYMNDIRDRVGVPRIDDAWKGIPGKDYREIIRQERTIELMFEGHRYFDARRWKIAHLTFAEP